MLFSSCWYLIQDQVVAMNSVDWQSINVAISHSVSLVLSGHGLFSIYHDKPVAACDEFSKPHHPDKEWTMRVVKLIHDLILYLYAMQNVHCPRLTKVVSFRDIK